MGSAVSSISPQKILGGEGGRVEGIVLVAQAQGVHGGSFLTVGTVKVWALSLRRLVLSYSYFLGQASTSRLQTRKWDDLCA